MHFVHLTISFCLLIGSVQLSAQEKLQFTLKEAQLYGIENSYQSQSATLNVDKAHKKVRETVGIGLPQIEGGGNYQKYLKLPVQLVPAEAFGGAPNEYVEFTLGTKQQMGMSLQATQLLFNGSYFVGLQASRVYLELSKTDKEKTAAEVKQLITQAYGSVLVTEENAKILSGNIENLKKSLEETKALYEAGFAEEQDRDQMELLLSNAKNSYDQAIQQIALSKNQLKFAMGIDIENEVELMDNIESISLRVADEDYLNKDFNIKDHIEYKSILVNKEASKLLLKEQRSNALPSLSAFYTYQQNSYSSEFNFFDDSKWFPTQAIGLNISVPIFSGLSRSYKVQQDKIYYKQAEIAQHQESQKLQIEVYKARTEYTLAIIQ